MNWQSSKEKWRKTSKHEPEVKANRSNNREISTAKIRVKVMGDRKRKGSKVTKKFKQSG